MKTTNIFLIRHGKVSNPNGTFYGRLPRMGLSEEGVVQISQTAKFLKQKNVARIFASPLLRTKQSSKIIQKVIRNPQPLISQTKKLIEVNSFMEGKPFSFGAKIRFDHYFSPLRKKGNDSIGDVASRMMDFVTMVFKKFPSKNVVALGHGDPIMILRAVIKKMPLELDSIRSGKVEYIKYGEVFRISGINSSSLFIRTVFKPQ